MVLTPYKEWKKALIDHFDKLRSVLEACGVSPDIAEEEYDDARREINASLEALEEDLEMVTIEEETEEE